MTNRRPAADPHREVLSRLASETGTELGELGVRPEDERWIRNHAETLDSLFEPRRPWSGGWGGFGRFGLFVYRLARKAARTAR